LIPSREKAANRLAQPGLQIVPIIACVTAALRKFFGKGGRRDENHKAITMAASSITDPYKLAPLV
jgi:hypothetical protein